MARGIPAVMVASAEILAADARVLREGVCEDGAINLIKGLWGSIRKELDVGLTVTRRWLDSDDFTALCDLCLVDPVATRDYLLTAHWRHRAA